tara:strand:- start:1402 stop:1896 length:495 start_codon:yes stop_codon:yes gene_type:complete
MSTILRYVINDVDSSKYTYSDHRIETTLLVASQLVVLEVDLLNDYTINVETCTLTPDPTETATRDDGFINLVCLKAACVMVGSEIRSEASNAISIKDGPSSIDLRGVAGTLAILYKDLSEKYEKTLLNYKTGNSIGGQAILGPYSPGSDYIARNHGHRSGGYLF